MRRGNIALDILFLASVFCFIISGQGYNSSLRHDEFISSTEKGELTGTVTKIMRRDSVQTRFVIQLDSLTSDALKIYGRKGVVTIKGDAREVVVGKKIEAQGQLTEPRHDAFSDFDYQEYLEANGQTFLFFAKSITQSKEQVWTQETVNGAVNEAFVGRLLKCGISEENVGFLRALVLADRSELRKELRQAFSDCGTSHVLAVSGMHVGIISGAALFLLKFFLRKRTACLIGCLLMWIYVFVIGFFPSVTRAAIMFTFLQLATILGRGMPRFHALWVALFVILLFDPHAVMSVGLWLSFMAVGGLMLAGNIGGERIRKMKWPLSWGVRCVVASVVAQVFTAPLILYTFGTFPVYFWIHNLVVLAVITPVLGGALLCPLLSFIPYVGSGFGFLLDKALYFLTLYVEWAAMWPGAVVHVDSFSLGEVVLFFILIFSFVAIIKGNKSKAIVHTIGLATAALIIINATEDATRADQRKLVLYGTKYQMAIALINGRHTTYCVTDSTNSGLQRATTYISKKYATQTSETALLNATETIIYKQKKALIINAPQDSLPTNYDVYIINTDLPPQDMPDSSKVIVTSGCTFKNAWKNSVSRGGNYTVEIIDEGQYRREIF